MMRPIAFLLLILLFSQCQKDEILSAPQTTSESAAYSQEFSLQVNEQAQLPGTGSSGKLYLKLLSLSDSRCPANAMCIHYGSASIVLLVSDGKGNSENLDLCIGDCPGSTMRDTHTVTTQVGGTTYKITLKAVQPYPGLEVTNEPKKAILFVEP